MTIDDLINGILTREGGYQDRGTDAGNAGGGATNFGITSPTWGIYNGLGRPATRAEVKAITRTQAAAFYEKQYVQNSPFNVIAYGPLRALMIDFGINSGNALATRWLQRCLDVPVTSVMDDRTITALNRDRSPLVTRAVCAARATMITGAVDHDHTIDHSDKEGLINRALSFGEYAL